MFEIWSHAYQIEYNVMFFVTLSLIILTVFLSILAVMKTWSKKDKESTLADIVLMFGTLFLFAVTMISIIMNYMTSFEDRIYGNPTGEVYNNPFDVPEDVLNDNKTIVRTNSEAFEEALTDALDVDKISISDVYYETFLDDQFGEFTGVITGDENDTLDDTSVSGVFYFTETDLVIITNYDTEHQENIRIATD